MKRLRKYFNLEKLKNKKIVKKTIKLIEKISLKIRTNLKYELIGLIFVCLMVSFVTYIISSEFLFTQQYRRVKTKFGIEALNNEANQTIDYLKDSVESGNIKVNDKKFFNEFLNKDLYEEANSTKQYITDLEGKVIYKSGNAKEEKFSIFDLISNSSNNPYNEGDVYIDDMPFNSSGKTELSKKPMPIIKIFPIKIQNEEFYFIFESVPEVIVETDIIESTDELLGLVVSTIAFILLFLYIINRKVKYLDNISDGIKIIASGNLGHRIKVVGSDEVSNIAFNVNLMATEIEEKMEIERAVEKTKSELITNVSHDLRTPLTSIMGYIGLLKENRYKNEEEMQGYLDIAFNKSESLKGLIEDLFEYTKITSAEMKIEKNKVNISSLISQIADEMTPNFEENDLMLIKSIVDEKIICDIDAEKMVRVLENLLGNANKYSYKPGTVIIGIYENDGSAIISIKNRGENIPKEKLDKLFDRFYRADESRNGETSGSGLGLAISKSIVNMHGGDIWVECSGNDIGFYIKLDICRN